MSRQGGSRNSVWKRDGLLIFAQSDQPDFVLYIISAAWSVNITANLFCGPIGFDPACG